jgi:hypothetical protein
MKISRLVLVLIFASVATTSYAKSPSRLVKAALKKAQKISYKAALGEDSSRWREIFLQLSRAEVTVHYNEDPEYDFVPCLPGKRFEDALAYVWEAFPSEIYICRRAFDFLKGKRRKVLGLAQILIHELSHTQGYWGECRASRIEMRAMEKAGKKLRFRSGHMDNCGL